MPLGHTVNANIAMVSAFSLHDDHAEASRRGEDGFRFFEYAVGALVTDDVVPGRSRLWEQVRSAQGGESTRPDRWSMPLTAARPRIPTAA